MKVNKVSARGGKILVPGFRRDNCSTITRIPNGSGALGLSHSTEYMAHTWSQWRRFAAAVLLPGSRDASSWSPAAAASGRTFVARGGRRALIPHPRVHAREMAERRDVSGEKRRPFSATSAATLTCHHREERGPRPDNRTSLLRVPPAVYALLPTLLRVSFLFFSLRRFHLSPRFFRGVRAT